MTYSLMLVRIFVSDLARAVRFYTEDVGIPLRFMSEEHGWAQLATGASDLGLECIRPGDAEGRALVGRFLGVSLSVEDVEATYRTLAARGVTFVEPPELQPWGGVLAHFRDPDGNVLTLVSAAKRT